MVFDSYYNQAYVTVENNKIIEVSKAFLELTEYTYEDVFNKSIFYLSENLKIDLNQGSLSMNNTQYIFTKSFDVRKVYISKEKKIDKIIFTFYEKSNSRSIDKFKYLDRLCRDNLSTVAIYSAPDLKLLKASKKYLDHLMPPFNKPENSIGESLSRVISNYNGEPVVELYKTVVETGEVLEIKEERIYNRITNSDFYRTTHLVPLLDDNNIGYIVTTIEDVTETVINRKAAERHSKVVKEQKELLEVILDNISDEIIIMDKDVNIIKMNETARKKYENLDIKSAEDVNKLFTFSDFNGRELPKEELMESYILRGEKIFRKQIIMKNKDKETYYYANAIPLFNNEGNLYAGVIACRDVTLEEKEKQNLAKTVIEQEKFFTNMSHELKTPLNVLLSALQVIELYDKNNRDFEIESNYRGIMKQNCYRLLRLVNNLMDISRIDSGFFSLELGNYNIIEIVENITSSVVEYAKTKGLNLIFDTNVEEKLINCDPMKIERIILNLLSNAVKFTDAGGEIKVSILDEGETVSIIVEDSGIGIPEDKINTIFERFKQVDKTLKRNNEGSGIGLSLVESLVEMHNGSIKVSSELDKGTKFVIDLPSLPVIKSHKQGTKLIKSFASEIINIEFSDIYDLNS